MKCQCTPDETTGWTSVKCCNICGKPLEDFWVVPDYELQSVLGAKGMVDIVYNFNQPEIKKQINCEVLAIYKDGRIVVQCYDIHGEKWESETFSRIEFFTPKINTDKKTYNGREVSEMMKASYKAGKRDNKNIESAIILLQEVKDGFLNPSAKIDKAISLLKL